MAEININFRKLERAATEAFKETCLITHRNIIQVISEPGAFDGFPDSDLIDTGLLRASQQPPEIQGDTAIFRNVSSYSAYVYLGYTLRNGKEVKGRPWMQEGIDRTNIQATFELLLKAKLS